MIPRTDESLLGILGFFITGVDSVFKSWRIYVVFNLFGSIETLVAKVDPVPSATGEPLFLYRIVTSDYIKSVCMTEQYVIAYVCSPDSIAEIRESIVTSSPTYRGGGLLANKG